MWAIKVDHLSKNFEQKTLFNDFSLRIEQNTVHALMGPNGAGKTSLLRLITGLYQPDQGTVQLKGKHAMLLENDYLYEDKTGLENLRLFGCYFGFELKDYQAWAQQLGIQADLERKVSTYSKGMKRKLSLLIIILMDRSLIFLDEVTSGVDPISRIQIRQVVDVLKDQGKTIVFTSHDLEEIEKVADWVTMIKEGQIVFTKRIQDLKGERLEDIFIEEGLK